MSFCWIYLFEYLYPKVKLLKASNYVGFNMVFTAPRQMLHKSVLNKMDVYAQALICLPLLPHTPVFLVLISWREGDILDISIYSYHPPLIVGPPHVSVTLS